MWRLRTALLRGGGRRHRRWSRLSSSGTTFTSTDTGIRLLHVTGEITFVYAAAATVVTALWYLLMFEPDVLADCAHRFALTHHMGMGPLFLSAHVPRSTPSHRVYSLLHEQSGDCFVYAVHFPSGAVFSTRVRREGRAGLDKERIHHGRRAEHPVDEYMKSQRIQFYTPQRGLGGGLEAYWQYTKDRLGDAYFQYQDTSERVGTDNAWFARSKILGTLVNEVAMHSVESLYWAALFPLRFATAQLFSAGADGILFAPAARDGSPDLEVWKSTLQAAGDGYFMGATPGSSVLDVAAAGQMRFPTPHDELRHAVFAAPIRKPTLPAGVSADTVTSSDLDAQRVTLTLDYDEWASGHLSYATKFCQALLFAGSAVVPAFLFRRMWVQGCAKTGGQFHGYISRSPVMAAATHGCRNALLSSPAAVAMAVVFAAPAYVEDTPMLPELTAMVPWYMIGLSFAHRAAFAYALRRTAAHEVVPYREPAAPLTGRRPVQRITSSPRAPRRNLSMGDAVELGHLRLSPAKFADKTLQEINKGNQEWREDVRKALAERRRKEEEEERKKELVDSDDEEQGSPKRLRGKTEDRNGAQ